MSMADVGGRQLVIHGPPVMTHYLASCRAYLRRESIRIQVREATIHESSTSNAEGSTDDRIAYQDENITVQAIPLLPTGFTLPSQDHSASPSRPPKRRRSAEILWAPTPESSQCVNIMFPNDVDKPALEADEEQAENMAKQDTALRLKLRERANANFRGIGSPPLQPVAVSDTSSLNTDYTKEQGPVLVYIVRGKDVAGKVDAAKAQLMGVPMGRHLRTLKEGKDIEITRPKDWTSYSAKERSTWASYSAMKESAAVLKAKGRPAAKKKRSEEQIEMENKLDQVETEQVIIKSADVVGESKAGFLFAQIYLPSTRYLDSFLADSMQSQLQFQATKPHTIVHAVHHEVLRDERYQGFIQSLKDTHHIIVSRPFLPDRLAYPSSALANLRMGYLDKALFPPPKYTLEPHLKLSDVGLKGDNVHLSELDTNIKLYPPAPPSLFDQSALNLDHSLDSQKVKRLITYEEGSGRKAVTEKDMEARRAAWKVYVEKAQSLSKSTAANGFTEDKDLWPLKLTTLGTGSALPNKHRNVSGALVHLPGKDAGYILLDAGESTYSQLTRKFGDRGVDDVVANIRLVFLSHIHADHHMGATRILAERAKLCVKRPLFVVAPSFVRKYLEEANQIQSLGISNDDIEANGVIMLNSEHLDSKRGVEVDSIAHPGQDTQRDKSRLWQEGLKAESVESLREQGLTFTDETLVSETTAKLYSRSSGERTRTQALRKHLTQLLHGTQVYTAEVDHRVSHCYGIVLRGNGWSGAYSGDTRPCKNLIEAGRGVDFLLHEATMEDELGAMAHMKGHSTFGQAIDVAKQMGAKYVILTHFSQRYAKMPKLNLRSDLGDLKVSIAFDLLTMQMSDVDKLMGYRETLELMYAVDQEEEDDTIPGETEGDLVMDGTEKPAVETSLNGAEEVAMEVDGPKSGETR
jgi:ribonuclease Z